MEILKTTIKNAINKEVQTSISPDNAIQLLQDGNKRYITKNKLDIDYMNQTQQTATGQYPYASVLSCIDSRIPTEIIFDQGVGDMFNARIAGNFVNEDILGSLEFACKLAGSKLIVVMGHTSCGAVKGACDKAELGNLTQMLAKINPAIELTETKDDEKRDSSNIDFVNRVAVKNVELTIKDIYNKSNVLADMVESGDIRIVGAMYDVKSGEVSFLN